MNSQHNQERERQTSRSLLSTSKIQIYVARSWQALEPRFRRYYPRLQGWLWPHLARLSPLEARLTRLALRLQKLLPYPILPESPLELVSGETSVLVVAGASSTCPACGGGPLLFEKAALTRESNTCPICTKTIPVSGYRDKLLECNYVVLEDLCEKCGLPIYAESQVDWVMVRPACHCISGSVRVNSSLLHERICDALTALGIAIPENMPTRGTKKVLCPFSGSWHKEPAMLYFKTGRIVCWNCRKMTSLLNLANPGSDEARATSDKLRAVSVAFWEPARPVKELKKNGRKDAPPEPVALPELPRLSRRELIDQWFSEKGHVPQRMASRYQQWLQNYNRIKLPIRPIPDWPPLVYSATVQRATHLERPGTTVHFVKGAVVTEDYTHTRQLVPHRESFWEDDSRHIVADLKVMDSVAARWEAQVYSFIEHNAHLLSQWAKTQGRTFCAYVQTEAVPGITGWAWGTGIKTPDLVLLSVSNNNKLLLSICDVKLSARSWTTEHDVQLSPENFRALLYNYPLLINYLLDAIYHAAPRLRQEGLQVEWPVDEAEFRQWLEEDRIQIQVGFRAIPDLPSRRRALLVTREKALHLNGNGNGRYHEEPIPDRPYLLVPCCLVNLYQDEPGARLAEELVNFDGVARARGQIGTWERLWLYEKYSRRGLALAYLLRRKGWDTSNPARLRYSLYECSAQLGVTTSSQFLAQLSAPTYHRQVSNF